MARYTLDADCLRSIKLGVNRNDLGQLRTCVGEGVRGCDCSSAELARSFNTIDFYIDFPLFTTEGTIDLTRMSLP